MEKCGEMDGVLCQGCFLSLVCQRLLTVLYWGGLSRRQGCNRNEGLCWVLCMKLWMWQESLIAEQSADVWCVHLWSAPFLKSIYSQLEYGRTRTKWLGLGLSSLRVKTQHWRVFSAPDWLGLESSWNALKVSSWRTSNVSADNSRKYPAGTKVSGWKSDWPGLNVNDSRFALSYPLI